MDGNTETIVLNVGVLWLVISTALVFFMQAGFLALEVGLSQKKNAINVGVKNLTDIGLSILLYWAIGYGIMYGASEGGIIGTDSFFPDVGQGGADLAIAFAFQAAFASTAVTILSGAVAGRMKFTSYLIIAVLVSGIIYPVYGHWVWNGGWLAERGFADFAGSTVVHSVGGWVALAALLIIGARKGRFNADGTPNDMPGSSTSLALIGVVILWFGWFGFNGGSELAWFSIAEDGTLNASSAVPGIIANTALGGAAGLVGALALGWIVAGHPSAGSVGNGALAGLVAVTANCHAIDASGAVIIGAIGGFIAIGAEQLLLRFKIDDVVGAIPVHLAAGAWGTLAFGIFAQEAFLNADSRGAQIVEQGIGIVAAAVWTFGATYAALWAINKVFPLRVSEEEEELGLNSEHGMAPAPMAPAGAMD
jgi:ammonium transporter, Amt family